MTGKHLGHAEIRGNRQVRDAAGKQAEGQYPITAEAVTVAEVLQQQGYATGAMGKWGLGPVGSSGAPHTQGFDLFFGYNCQAVAHSFFPAHLWRNGERVPLNTRAIPGHARQPEGPVRMEDWQGERAAPEAMLAEAVRFLHDQKRDQPFFLYLPLIEPHVALQPPPRLVESYPSEWDERPYRGQCGYLPHPRPRAAYAAMITSLDEHVGKIMSTLDELRLTENTLVLFTSDNGPTHDHAGDEQFGVGGVDTEFFQSTAGLRGRKGSVYEGGLRVPLIARWPQHIAPGTVSDYPCYFADYFPTLCAVGGAPKREGLDGVDLGPLLLGTGVPPRRTPLVWVFPEYGGQLAVRLGNWKLVRQNVSRPRQASAWELYDLARDQRETENVAAAQPQVVSEAIALLRAETLANAIFPLSIPAGLPDER
jgi:arylsulfatase A-like enzyme